VRSDIDRLLKERQATILHERRSVERQPFVRPVAVLNSRNGEEKVEGFSKDMSQHGIAIISPSTWRPGARATLHIHSLYGANVSLQAEARWSEAFGEGWFITGWHFSDLD
jgi:hypothetical protein